MSRWWLLLVALATAGCYRVPDDSCAIRCGTGSTCPNGLTCGVDNLCTSGIACGQPGIDASNTDAPQVDAAITPDGTVCYGAGLVEYCPTNLTPMRRIEVGDLLTVDSSDPPMNCTEIITVNGTEMCVIAADALTIDGRVRAIGHRPLVLFGRTSVTINGLVDVSAGGAGGGSCASESGLNAPFAGASAGGGAGGSFGGIGGFGGSANNAVSAEPGLPVVAPPPSLRGGCAGGAGGHNSLSSVGGPGGSPGGAVYVLSGGSIVMTGAVNASGGGGRGGTGVNDPAMKAGGGGGGSGGLIFLEAPSVTLALSSTLLAHGAGAGGGTDGVLLGGDGNPPAISRPMDFGSGGLAADPSSGDGGSGSYGTSLSGSAGENASTGGSGGGGGGGAGLILVKTPMLDDSGRVFPPLVAL